MPLNPQIPFQALPTQGIPSPLAQLSAAAPVANQFRAQRQQEQLTDIFARNIRQTPGGEPQLNKPAVLAELYGAQPQEALKAEAQWFPQQRPGGARLQKFVGQDGFMYQFNPVSGASEQILGPEGQPIKAGSRFATPKMQKFAGEGGLMYQFNPVTGDVAPMMGPMGKQLTERPSFTTVEGEEKVYKFNKGTGEFEPLAIKPKSKKEREIKIKKYQADIEKAKVEQEKIILDIAAREEALIGDLPAEEAKAAKGISIIDRMIGSADKTIPAHPGFEWAVGLKGPTQLFGLVEDPVAGSDEADFVAFYNQITGPAFLEAFQDLKGGGHITEIEGEKATEAITSLKRSRSEKGFVKAGRELQDILRKGLERKKRKAKRLKAGQGEPGFIPSYPTIKDMEAANLPDGTKIILNGIPGTYRTKK